MKLQAQSPLAEFLSRIQFVKSKTSVFDSTFSSWEVVTRSSVKPAEVVSQGKDICKDYIREKLKSEGFLNRKLDLSSEKKSQVSTFVIAVGNMLEKRHPKVYTDLSRKLIMTMSDQKTVDKTLTKILQHLFEDGATWPKVISMFAIAGQFALECVVQGHSEFVNVVIESIGLFVNSHVADWIVMENGWIGVVEAFRRKQDSRTLKVFTIVGVAVGFLATIIATVRIR